MGTELLEVIRDANREFQEFIEKVSQDGAKVVESRGAARRLEKLDLRLKQVSQHLDSASPSAAHQPEAAYQFMKYRENLKTLRNILETLQFSLLAEKARLESTRANMQAACAWASSVREIS
jgi:hypothetical protein